jgi:hypothetical protein
LQIADRCVRVRIQLHCWLAISPNVSILKLLMVFGLGAFFGYFGLLVFLEFYESQRPGPKAENRRDIQKLINRCAIWGAFVIGLVSLGLYLSS